MRRPGGGAGALAASIGTVTHLPMPTLLSQALVAFTIELDNEFEHLMPHRTSSNPSANAKGALWLVSMVMWFNCMRFVTAEPMPVRELERRARTATNLAGMQRWGYIAVEPDPTDRRSRPPRSSLLVWSTRAGREAQEVWRPLVGVVEKRWEQRFGVNDVVDLRTSLARLVCRLDLDLPDCLPILGYGLWSAGPFRDAFPIIDSAEGRDATLSLPELLARTLLMFAIDFESESGLSLAITANVLRVLAERETRLRELPRLAGVSKEAISMALGVLGKGGIAEVHPDSTGTPGRVARLTPNGRKSQVAHGRLLSTTEERWQLRFGRDLVGTLRDCLEPLVGEPSASPLLRGLDPYPDGWRASVRPHDTLPHFPMVLHRGGYPDGS